MKGKRVWLWVGAVVALSITLWAIWGNTALQCNTVTVSTDAALNGFRIAHISDLHNASFGKENRDLLELLENAHPDVIAITGDLVDSRRTDVAVALAFAKKAAEIAPCYYVTGNHEARIGEYDRLEEGLLEAGIHVLRDTGEEFIYQGTPIQIIGLDDPAFEGSESWHKTDRESALHELEALIGDKTEFTLLLSHRPELFDAYCAAGVDLTLSGHAHGGQFRLPWIGGLIAPNQGLFPKYDAGLYQTGTTVMVVSRGLGNSILPIRFNNRPEVVIIEIAKS